MLTHASVVEKILAESETVLGAPGNWVTKRTQIIHWIAHRPRYVYRRDSNESGSFQVAQRKVGNPVETLK